MAQPFNLYAGKKCRPIIIIPGLDDDQPRDQNPPRQVAPPAVPRANRGRHDLDLVLPAEDDLDVRGGRPLEEARAFFMPDRAQPVAVPVRAPAPVGRIVAHHRPEDQVEHLNNMSEYEKTEMFWNLIQAFQWRNASDGAVNARAIQNTVNQYSPLQRKLFTDMYNHHYDAMKVRLEADGMFERNEVRTLQDQAKVISHAIAMGMDQFNTLFADPEFYQFFIESGECQSLDMLLPADMQH